MRCYVCTRGCHVPLRTSASWQVLHPSVPVHGAVFDLSDGSVQAPPAFEDLETFEVKIDGTSISVKKSK